MKTIHAICTLSIGVRVGGKEEKVSDPGLNEDLILNFIWLWDKCMLFLCSFLAKIKFFVGIYLTRHDITIIL